LIDNRLAWRAKLGDPVSAVGLSFARKPSRRASRLRASLFRGKQMIPMSAVREYLAKIELAYGVKILFAVESGSRAWGMHSEDSDYDVRFVYTRPLAWYVSIHERRDVIEPPCEHPYDINGWDLKKALYQLKRGNPAFFEWLHAPQYLTRDSYMADLMQMAKIYFNSKTAIYHYMHMASGNFRQYIINKEQPLIKKYLYVIRPLLCCEHIAKHNEQPHSDMRALMSEHVPHDVYPAIKALVDRKRAGDELGKAEPIAELNQYISGRLEHFKQFSHTTAKGIESHDMLDEYLFRVVSPGPLALKL
jgi:predicted nucleotidyltransferase